MPSTGLRYFLCLTESYNREWFYWILFFLNQMSEKFHSLNFPLNTGRYFWTQHNPMQLLYSWSTAKSNTIQCLGQRNAFFLTSLQKLKKKNLIVYMFLCVFVGAWPHVICCYCMLYFFLHSISISVIQECVVQCSNFLVASDNGLDISWEMGSSLTYSF